MGQFDPLPCFNPSTNHPKNYAGVIMSWISVGLPNFIKFALGVLSWHIRVFAHPLFTALFFHFWGFFWWPTAETTERILTQNTSTDAFPCNDVPFGVPKTTQHLDPFLTKYHIFGTVLTVLWQFSTVNRFIIDVGRSFVLTSYSTHYRSV